MYSQAIKELSKHGSRHSEEDIMEAVFAALRQIVLAKLTPGATRIALLMLQEAIRQTLVELNSGENDG